MVREKYGVRLTAEQRNQLQHLVRAGKGTARVTVRARILLKTDEGWSAPQVAQALDVAEGTVFRIKRRFAEEGLEGVLQDRPQARRYRKLDDRGEAHLIALACSEPPEGHDHWTLRLLAGQVVELGLAPSLSHETVRLHLKKLPQAVAEAGVRGATMVELGTGEYSYEVIEDWAKLPNGWSFKETAAVGADSNDNVYVFSRGEHPGY